MCAKGQPATAAHVQWVILKVDPYLLHYVMIYMGHLPMGNERSRANIVTSESLITY